MYSSLLSALFLGLLPLPGLYLQAQLVTLEDIEVAPPAALLILSQPLSASGVLVMDAQSGQSVYAQQENVQRAIGSLTKLMTALVIAENHTMDEIVRIPKYVGDIEGNKAYLPPGQHFTVGDLLSALLIASANDAAETLAIHHAGSVSAFVEDMNARATALGLRQTSYANPSGLDAKEQYSTPQEIAWLTKFALGEPEIRERMETSGKPIRSREGHVIHLTHTHALLHTDPMVLAGKTGTTRDAGQCLVSLVEENGREYLVVLLHSRERYRDTKTILNALAPQMVSAANIE